MEIYGNRLHRSDLSALNKGGSRSSSISSATVKTVKHGFEAPSSDQVSFSDELKETQKQDLKKVESLKKSRESRKVDEITRSHDTRQVRKLEEKDLKKRAEQSTLRSNRERQVKASKKSTASKASASTTQTVAQPQTRIKFRTVGQTRGHKETLFNGRRPVRRVSRQQYVHNLASTFAIKD